MKTTIIYSTSHGCTEKVVQELSQKLSGEVVTINFRTPDPIFEKQIVTKFWV